MDIITTMTPAASVRAALHSGTSETFDPSETFGHTAANRTYRTAGFGSFQAHRAEFAPVGSARRGSLRVTSAPCLAARAERIAKRRFHPLGSDRPRSVSRCSHT